MKKLIVLVMAMVFAGLSLFAGTPGQDHAVYEVQKPDKVLKKLKDESDNLLKSVQKKREAHEKMLKEEKDKKKKEKKRFWMDFSNVKVPASPDAFKSSFHFPPVPQYYTGTCWSFSTTSYMESEIYRLHKKKIKLSEMYTVYWEYVEKVRRFVREYGHSLVDEGSEADAIPAIWRKYGIVPESAYPGYVNGKNEFNHLLLMKELKGYLDYVKKLDMWDETEILAHTRTILNKYLGVPPTSFQYEGKDYTPVTFLTNACGLNMDDYLEFTSFEYMPFWQKGEYKVPDNWRHAKDAYNVPLATWYSILNKAMKNGFTIAIGGDVSEPGYRGTFDAGVVPDFDIPEKLINQDSREMRFYNRTSTDDHGIHMVGWTHFDGHDWYLIKDSSRSARKGKFEGYMFYREDYVKLKMLDFMINKSAVDPKILKQFDEKEIPPKPAKK
jgi:bleomycin hydrolase